MAHPNDYERVNVVCDTLFDLKDILNEYGTDAELIAFVEKKNQIHAILKVRKKVEL